PKGQVPASAWFHSESTGKDVANNNDVDRSAGKEPPPAAVKCEGDPPAPILQRSAIRRKALGPCSIILSPTTGIGRNARFPPIPAFSSASKDSRPRNISG